MRTKRWSTVGQYFPTWRQWNQPWSTGAQSALQPDLIAGNQQGYIFVRDEGTGEGNSLTITSISGNTITSPNHALNTGDYIIISGALGTVGAEINGNIYRVGNVMDNTFTLNPNITGAGTYLGGGEIKRMYIPFIQTKQFPTAWSMARKTRMCSQKYLFTKTSLGEVSLYIYLSQNGANPYNFGPIVPEVDSNNDALIYSTKLYTCPESTNLGLTPANINLQAPAANDQAQIWHRMNTSLIGDTIQVAITLNDEQMRDTQLRYQFTEIELHGFIIDVAPGPYLA